MSDKITDHKIRTGYNNLSSLYDILLYLGGGYYYRKAENSLIQSLPDHIKNCLIIGGGTGAFLKKLVESNKTCTINYLDISEKMIRKALKRVKHLPNFNNITFYKGNWDSLTNEKYELVCLNYFLDLFDEKEITKMISHFKSILNQGGYILLTDLQQRKSNGISNVLFSMYLKVVYLFFQKTTGIKTKTLYDSERLFLKNGFSIVEKKEFAGGFLKSVVLKLE